MTTSRPSSGKARHRKPGGKGVALAVLASCQLMVVLDITIVNIALPHIQRALDFSTANLSWVVNAYTLAFGGLLLLGGRSGDLLGRRRVFIVGVALFVVSSLLGGLAQSEAELLAARAAQGIGAAIASPTALALITTTFAEGPERNRAFGVFAAVSAGGGAIGLVAGGILVEWLDWRWVFFVNVPIGLLIIAATLRVIPESARRRGRFDVVGAVTSTAGMAALVYAFIRASDDGWTNPLTIAAFAVAVVLLAAFVLVERRSREPITPLRMFRERNRAGAYGMMVCLSASLFGMFFFLTLYVQEVLGFSPLVAGLSFLPITALIAVGSGLASQLLPRIGPKPFLVAGSVLAALGMVWLTQIHFDSTYAGSVLGPMLVMSSGLGMQFVSLTLMAVSGVEQREAGAASGLLNACQQVGGSLGLSILVTVSTTASRDETRALIPRFLAQATPAERLRFQRTRQLPSPFSEQVLTAGAMHAFIAAAGLSALGVLVALFVIRVSAADLESLQGMQPGAAPAGGGSGGAGGAGGTRGADGDGRSEPP